MKKITFAIALVSFCLNAQDFPSPYCDIDAAGTSVEAITSVELAGLTITNADNSSILIDKTDFTAEFYTTTYTLSVSGNTEGDFDNKIVAFIDWNENDILDDAGEVFEIGTLSNSNGNDGISVSAEIDVPFDTEVGLKRIRITKTYTDDDSVAEIDPCAIAFNPFGQGVFPGFGQALDFNISTGLLGVDEFDVNALSIYPNPAKSSVNISYKSSLVALKIYNTLGQEVDSKNNLGSSVELDLSNLESGIYILKLLTTSESQSFRIVKQ